MNVHTYRLVEPFKLLGFFCQENLVEYYITTLYLLVILLLLIVNNVVQIWQQIYFL